MSRTFKCSLPYSLADAVKRLQRPHAKVPDLVRAFILKYWRDHGERLRAYRDLAQHHAVVSSEALIRNMPGGQRLLFLVLPNDPYRKSLRELTYEPPYVSAIAYCFEEFAQLFRFLYELLYLLLRILGNPRTVTMVITFKAPLTMGTAAGYIALGPSTLDDLLWSLREEGKASAEAAFGTLEAEPMQLSDT